MTAGKIDSGAPGEPISEREFELYALSLPRGPNFYPFLPCAAWKTKGGGAVGAVLVDPDEQRLKTIVLRRRIDHRFVLAHEGKEIESEEEALADLAAELGRNVPPLALPPGEKRRPALLDTGKRKVGDYFSVLTGTVTHRPALMAVGETYLALPRPDDNFVPDFQTENFDSRLWELYLLAAFREQGIAISQDVRSPDFLIERAGQECWVEAVTANPVTRAPGFPPPVHAPEDKAERFLGAPAERFAKTLRSKLQREYEKAPHVHGKPFALAIADFHAPGSMVWSREALPSYLYGIHAQVAHGPAGRVAAAESVHTLRGADAIPAGLFRDPAMAHLSAVIFSNAATMAKFNRMGFLAGWRPPGVKMIRQGIIFDRRPNAFEPIPFAMDVLSEEYEALWPGGEAWCQELEVLHNPLATHPIDFDLIPGATHWFEQDGEIICSTIWEHSVLSSMTHLRLEQDPDS